MRKGWTLFAFGARDEVDSATAATASLANPTLAPTLVLGFHRLDLRAYYGSGAWDGTYRLVGGVDTTLSGGANLSTYVLEPSMRWKYRMDQRLDIVTGLEGSFHDTSQDTGATGAAAPGGGTSITQFTGDISKQYLGSALVEALWRPTPNWLIRPGVRGDIHGDFETGEHNYRHFVTKPSADPRLAVRYKLMTRDLPGEASATNDDRAVWIKAGAGIYHEPPRFFLPLPGLDTMPLSYGLLQSIQTSVGLEVPLGTGFNVNVEGSTTT